MTTEVPKNPAYEKAVEDATTLFLKVMDLHGFTKKDDLDEFQKQISKSVTYSFYRMQGGPDPDAEKIIEDMLAAEYRFPKKPEVLTAPPAHRTAPLTPPRAATRKVAIPGGHLHGSGPTPHLHGFEEKKHITEPTPLFGNPFRNTDGTEMQMIPMVNPLYGDPIRKTPEVDSKQVSPVSPSHRPKP